MNTTRDPALAEPASLNPKVVAVAAASAVSSGVALVVAIVIDRPLWATSVFFMVPGFVAFVALTVALRRDQQVLFLARLRVGLVAERWWGTTAAAVARGVAVEAVTAFAGAADAADAVRAARALLAEHVVPALTELAEASPSADVVGRAVAEELGEDVGRSVQEALVAGPRTPIVVVSGSSPGVRVVPGTRFAVRSDGVPEVTLVNPALLVVDGDFLTVGAVLGVAAVAASRGQPLVVVAYDLDEGVAGSLAAASPPVRAVVPVGAFGSHRSALLSDLAVLTGAGVVAAAADLGEARLGAAGLACVRADEVTIASPAGEPAAVTAQFDAASQALAASSGDYDREKLAGRLGMLAGEVAVLTAAPPLQRVQWGVDLAGWAGGGVLTSTALAAVRRRLTGAGLLRGDGGRLVEAVLTVAEDVLAGRAAPLLQTVVSSLDVAGDALAGLAGT